MTDRWRAGLLLCVGLCVGSFLTGCDRRAQAPGESAPVLGETAAGAGADGGLYQFSAEPGFSADLGDRPSFTPGVAPYTVAPDLGNVDNLRLFSDMLLEDHRQRLAKEGFVVVPADYRQMEFCYELNNYPDEHLPSFVTADSILHTYHIFFDYCLRVMEVSTLYERAETLSRGLLQTAAARYGQEGPAEVKEAALRNYAYSLVPVKLLETPESDWGVTVPEEVAALAQQELGLIEAHEGFKVSPTVGLKVDYSQFVPRGHYTRSDKLKRYFKAIMWYGLVPVALRNAPGDLMPTQARQAVLLADALLRGRVGEEPLGKVWEDIYEPTAFLVGFADDNTPGDYGKVIPGLFGDPVDVARLVPTATLEKLAAQVLKLRPSQIVAVSLTNDAQFPGIPQFRLMGQRFILDSYVFQHMVVPFVGEAGDAPNDPGAFNKRTFPMGLDVMSALGSQRAYQIADEVYKQTRFANYGKQSRKLRAEIEKLDDKTWTSSTYYGWLHALKFLLQEKKEGYPGFMHGVAWTDKQLHAALGSWAELRHDTILYAKQSVVAECGGEGGEKEPPPPPKGYVEPEVLMYWRLGLLATQLKEGLAARKLLADEGLAETFDELISLLKFLQEVSIKELEGKTLTADEYRGIEFYGDTLARLNLYSKRGAAGDEITSMTDKDMAVVADVHTGPIGDGDYALEEGVGHANEIYAVYPCEGKLLIGRGATFSYYEFTVPVAERMTDEQWQERLSGDNKPGPPEWVLGFMSEYPREGDESLEVDIAPEFTRGGC